MYILTTNHMVLSTEECLKIIRCCTFSSPTGRYSNEIVLSLKSSSEEDHALNTHNLTTEQHIARLEGNITSDVGQRNRFNSSGFEEYSTREIKMRWRWCTRIVHRVAGIVSRHPACERSLSTPQGEAQQYFKSTGPGGINAHSY